MSNDKVTIYDRRGAVDDRPIEKQGLDPWDESNRAYAQLIEKQARRDRYWNGLEEFEPALFNTLDDADELREMAADPMLMFVTGVTMERAELIALRMRCKTEHEVWLKARPARKPKEPVRLQFMEPLYSIGVKEPTDWNVWVKVIPLPHADWEHVSEFKMPRYGDLSVNLTEGEQMEVKRESGGSRLKEEELAMDFRSPSKFLLDEALFITVDFELPNVPEDVIKWLEETAWPNHDAMRGRLEAWINHLVHWKAPGMDNRRREVKAVRRAFQARMLNVLWGKFWAWWTQQCEVMKPTGRRPMTNRQLASIKAMFEQMKSTLNLHKPDIKFWARVHCTHCETQFNRLLPLSYEPERAEGEDDIESLIETSNHEPVKCGACKQHAGVVLWFEEHSVIKERGKPDWFEIAQDLKEKIAALYKVAADIDEIKPLENRLHYIEHMHIKIPADQLLWGEHDAFDARFI
jgi:hypothetical protein